MKIAHWTMGNASGMHRVAESMVKAEVLIGLNSILVNLDIPATFADADDADIHVSHTHLPDFWQRTAKGQKVVWVGHGTPEHVFHSAVEAGLMGGYGHGDAWMLMQFWLQHSDAIVTQWPRHAEIFKNLCDKHTQINVIPMGIDTDFWKPIPSKGKFVGNPSVLTAENAHFIKWPLDLFITWSYLTKKMPTATLHALYLPRDQHRWFFPLVNRTGVSYSSYITGSSFAHPDLRNAFCSVDFYCGLVKYGDYNRVMMEAKASGCKTISYEGNPYSDYWLTEGDQRRIATQLEEILLGNVIPRETLPVPTLEEMAVKMKEVYEGVLA